LLEARPCADETDAEIVAGAWDFHLINRRYAEHLKVLDHRPVGALRDATAAEAFRRWTTEERAAWSGAVSLDPLLPERLLPPGYLGRQVWGRRVEVLREAAWSGAVSLDPLLPERLLPPGYLGRQAWGRRVEVLREAGRQLRTFKG
jgi:DNA-binding transcriptional regulator PaaX